MPTCRYVDNPQALASALVLTFSVTVINPIAPISCRLLKGNSHMRHACFCSTITSQVSSVIGVDSCLILVYFGGLGTLCHAIAVVCYDGQQFISVFENYNKSPDYDVDTLWLLVSTFKPNDKGQHFLDYLY